VVELFRWTAAQYAQSHYTSQLFYMLEGVHAERTSGWNIRQNIVGISCLIIGGS
jgi:hypothetical protein